MVHAEDGVPVTLRQIARVGIGPAGRRGVLDKAGTEAVGGVVVARFGANPLEVIESVRAKIAELAPALPRRLLDDGTEARVRVVPFYDRSGLIEETLGTLEDALSQQLLVAVLVILVMVARARVAGLVAATLPLAVLLAFVGMRLFGVQANVVSLAGIAIAVGTLVDVGIVLTESILQHLAPDQDRGERLAAVRRGVREVAGAMTTAVATTVVGFLPGVRHGRSRRQAVHSARVHQDLRPGRLRRGRVGVHPGRRGPALARARRGGAGHARGAPSEPRAGPVRGLGAGPRVATGRSRGGSGEPAVDPRAGRDPLARRVLDARRLRGRS